MLVGGTGLFASYSGLMGGAERVLLDAAGRVGRPLRVACPEGGLGGAVRAAGLEQVRVRERPLAARPGRICGLARELTGLARKHRPDVLVAWGARAVLAAALVPRRPPVLAVHHD